MSSSNSSIIACGADNIAAGSESAAATEEGERERGDFQPPAVFVVVAAAVLGISVPLAVLLS
ncbi:hypothetical protein CVT25_010464 [Psilocybe cyanescens]|uniref:Uncharacterized protein n=1 Tax=Psilocybe cyanescens TaxID=93625 RepID=A0A409XDF7_PSICY|nr:hypothetical protein CVT25_010464 [Psilocybe cyanescens]